MQCGRRVCSSGSGSVWNAVGVAGVQEVCGSGGVAWCVQCAGGPWCVCECVQCAVRSEVCGVAVVGQWCV